MLDHAHEKMPPMPTELREIFRSAYLFRQRHQNPTGSPELWRRAADDMRLELARLKEHPFAKALFFCCYKDIEREIKSQTRSQL